MVLPATSATLRPKDGTKFQLSSSRTCRCNWCFRRLLHLEMMERVEGQLLFSLYSICGAQACWYVPVTFLPGLRPVIDLLAARRERHFPRVSL
ncbi:hypothetical protein BDV10DRAFT_81856 [Aspergillus recurvatus]